VSETDIVKAILLELSKRDCVVWKNNSGKLPDRFGRWVTFGLEGSSDVLGWCKRCGCAVTIEAKTPKGRLRAQQRQFLAMAAKAGTIGGVARNALDAILILHQHRRERCSQGCP
jgi:hypothetical protein